MTDRSYPDHPGDPTVPTFPTPLFVCFATVEGASPCRRRNAETGDTCQRVEGHDGSHAVWASPEMLPYRTWPQAPHFGSNGEDR